VVDGVRGTLVGIAVAVVVLCAACDAPAPPPVAVREATLEAEDLAVIRALLDHFHRNAGLESLRAQDLAARLLVVNTTTAMCRRDPGVLGPPPGRCLSSYHANVLSEVVPPEMFPAVKLFFPSWNASGMSISGSLGDHVTLVSPTLLDMTPVSELLRRHPRGSTIMWLSTPGYPAPDTAVIVFGYWAHGGARLERQQDGSWRVVATAWKPQD
jgi:hypothetical protein